MPADFKAIENNTTDQINLMTSLFTDEYAVKLATSIEKNTSVKSMDLSYCNLVNSEFITIANALLKHPPLDSLNFEDNLLGNDSIPVLIKLVEQKKFKYLNIKNNKFDVMSLDYNNLKKAISDNTVSENVTISSSSTQASRKSTEMSSVNSSRGKLFDSSNSSTPDSPNTPSSHSSAELKK